MKNECLDFFARDDIFFFFFCALLFLPSGVYVKDVMCNVFFVTARKKMIVYIPLCVRDNNKLSQGDPSA